MVERLMSNPARRDGGAHGHGSPLRSGGRPGSTELRERAERTRLDAEIDAAREVAGFYRTEKAKIEADATMTDLEKQEKLRELLLEVGRRGKRAMRKARRDNSPAKLLLRDVEAETRRDGHLLH
jgi:hypothetical protein